MVPALGVWLLVGLAGIVGGDASAGGPSLRIRNARLVDATGAPPREGVTILVRDGRIAAIGDSVAAEDAPLLDVAGATVLPGLMDAHVHFIAAPGGSVRGDTRATRLELNRQHLRAYLACGVTTVLDAGIDPLTAREIQLLLAGDTPGPRFFTTGPYVRPVGGYGSEEFGAESTSAEVEAKLDLIPTLGGVGVKLAFEKGWNPLSSLSGFGPELERAIVEGAARRKLPLYVHATSEEAQEEALAWGARGIMHAVVGGRWLGQVFAPRDLSDEFVARMKASGTYQVTTLSVIDHWPGLFDRDRLDDELVRQSVPASELATARDPAADRIFAVSTLGLVVPWLPESLRPAIGSYLWTPENLREGLRYSQQNLLRLWKAGVPIAVGSDAPSLWPFAPYHFHGPATLREIELLGEAGIPPMAAIIAATRVPAEMLGLAAELGTVEVGKRADLIVVRDDPLRDLRALRTIRWTIRDGVARTPEEWLGRGATAISRR